MASARLKTDTPPVELAESMIDVREITQQQVQRLIESGEPASWLNVLLTPEIASFMLRYNPSGENRPQSEAFTNTLIRALRSERWENTGEPIVFSDTAQLNDGQTRLQAIATSGIAAIVDLRFGVPRHAFAATNSGRRRSPGDALKLSGLRSSVSNALAGIVRLTLQYVDGLPGAVETQYSNLEIVQAVEQWPDLITADLRIQGLGRGLQNSMIGTMAFFAGRTANDASVEGFMDVLRRGHGDADNPPHALREHLLMHSRFMRGSRDRVGVFGSCIVAWNAWQKNERITHVRWTRTGPFPKVNGLKL